MNQIKTKIEEVKAKLGLTQMQLSQRIGKNPYYLDTVKHRGVTTERQLELIRELDLVANGGTVMTERAVIASLSEQLVEAQSVNNDLRVKLEGAEYEYDDLNDAYGRACEKLADMRARVESLQEYKQQYRNLMATVLVIGIIVILGLAIWSVV